VKTDKPYEVYAESVRQQDEEITPIDDLPNKDWLRAQ